MTVHTGLSQGILTTLSTWMCGLSGAQYTQLRRLVVPFSSNIASSDQRALFTDSSSTPQSWRVTTWHALCTWSHRWWRCCFPCAHHARMHAIVNRPGGSVANSSRTHFQIAITACCSNVNHCVAIFLDSGIHMTRVMTHYTVHYIWS